MKSAVITFPGSNCDRDMITALKLITGSDPINVWHKENDFPNVDLIAVPGGFSYGDYLRCGAISARSPIMSEVVKRAHSGVTTIGICNGFQILTECDLLPGALIRNQNLDFICEDTPLEICHRNSRFTNAFKTVDITLPVAHHDGSFVADDVTLDRLEGEGHILIRYRNNINGSKNRIAALTNDKGNILGMMPHPERAADPATGGTDGRYLFKSILNALN